MINGVLDGLSDQSLSALCRYGFDTNTDILWEPDLSRAHLVDQKVDHLFSLIGIRLVFDTRVDVFRILPEDNHVGIARRFHG